VVPSRGQAATRGEVETPAVQGAGEDSVGDAAELGQVDAQVRAAALHAPAVQADVRAVIVALVVPVLDPVLDVVQALL